ncbi:acyl-CoA dehydrogenase family protein [Nocardioides sp.]|uniref:acyl-CoA dehydrogenase family protein n=1 Tax=Nocardioides sp. TaxID=35761 RepID=UPI003D0B6D36
MKRHLYSDDHESFRQVVRAFVDREVVGNVERWDDQRLIDREIYVKAGRQGIIGLSTPEEYGGAGQERDYRFRNVVHEEFAKVFATSLSSSFSLHDDIVLPYFAALGTAEQKQRWLPSLASGESIGAIAMTEPETGSDLRGIKTSGERVEGGWVVNGSKTFISSGQQADLVIVVVRTDPGGGSRAFSLLVVERGMEGFTRGRKLAKVGLHGQDTSELAFEDVFVPDGNLLGAAGGGFGQLVTKLPIERLSIGAQAIAIAEGIFASTLEYVQQRHAFGKPISDFQNTRFELASMSAELDVTRAFIDRCIVAHGLDELSAVDAAKAKLWATEVQVRTVDRCVQLHGGYGFMLEYPVGRAYQDARVQRIHGGTSEIMKEIISRDLVGR